MEDDLARDPRAEDYEFLRQRARAHLHAVEASGPVATLDRDDAPEPSLLPDEAPPRLTALEGLGEGGATPRPRFDPEGERRRFEPEGRRRRFDRESEWRSDREHRRPKRDDATGARRHPRFEREPERRPDRGHRRSEPGIASHVAPDPTVTTEARPQPAPRRVSAPRAYGSQIGAPAPDRAPRAGGEPGRRTVQITGQVARPARRPVTVEERFAARPDRTAMWAVLLGLFLVFVAVATAHASPPAPHALNAAAHAVQSVR